MMTLEAFCLLLLLYWSSNRLICGSIIRSPRDVFYVAHSNENRSPAVCLLCDDGLYYYFVTGFCFLKIFNRLIVKSLNCHIKRPTTFIA